MIKLIKSFYIKNNILYKIYASIRFEIPHFIKNVWKFRKALSNHHWFDHSGLLMFVEISLKDISDNVLEKGFEIDETRFKKVEKMRRVIEIIKNYNENKYIDMAESEIGNLILRPWEFKPVDGNPELYELVDKKTSGEKKYNKKIYNRSREIEEKEWNELFDILKGQDYSNIPENIDFNDYFDGSGLKNWWD